eukprot:scaffold128_cov248-Pinguiococcus_pyrenoidosus.AAC.3
MRTRRTPPNRRGNETGQLRRAAFRPNAGAESSQGAQHPCSWQRTSRGGGHKRRANRFWLVGIQSVPRGTSQTSQDRPRSASTLRVSGTVAHLQIANVGSKGVRQGRARRVGALKRAQGRFFGQIRTPSFSSRKKLANREADNTS